MKIIDFHTHPGPKSVLTEEFHFPPMTSETFVNELRRAGISMACGSTFEVPLLSARQRLRNSGDEPHCMVVSRGFSGFLYSGTASRSAIHGGIQE